MFGYSWIFALVVILFIPSVFADDKLAETEFDTSATYGFQPGFLKFDTDLNGISCDEIASIPKVKTGRSLNIDEMDGYFFIILGKTDFGEYHYLQIQLPEKNGQGDTESYLLDFKKQDEVVRGGLYQDYDQLAVYMETDKESKEFDYNNYKRFLIGQSKDVTPSNVSLGPGDYDMHSILFQSNQSNWIKDQVCAISLHWPVSVDSMGYIDTKTPQIEIGRIYEIEKIDPPHEEEILTYSSSTEVTNQQNSSNKETDLDREVWVDPKRDTVSISIGTLEFEEIPNNFNCAITPKVEYQYVEKNYPVQYPDHDSLFMRIGGEDTEQDFQIIFSLWDNNQNTYAKDHSYHLQLKNSDGTDGMGGIYSPDPYSDYSTLGVMVEANNKLNKYGILPADTRERFTELFGTGYVVPVGLEDYGDYQLFVRVFDSEDDWIVSDTCGLQAIIPIKTSGEDNVTVGQIQFSNIKVSAINTDYPKWEEFKKNSLEAAERKKDESLGIDNQIIIQDEISISTEKNIGSLRWINANSTADSYGTLELIDPDLNQQTDRVDVSFVQVSSNANTEGIELAMVETDKDTGIFYGDLDFSLDKSSTSKLKVSREDVVTAVYNDTTLPAELNESSYKVTDTLKIIPNYSSPYNQLKVGMEIDDITCNDYQHQLFIKDNIKPLCIKQDTYNKLVQRGYFE